MTYLALALIGIQQSLQKDTIVWIAGNDAVNIKFSESDFTIWQGFELGVHEQEEKHLLIIREPGSVVLVDTSSTGIEAFRTLLSLYERTMSEDKGDCDIDTGTYRLSPADQSMLTSYVTRPWIGNRIVGVGNLIVEPITELTLEDSHARAKLRAPSRIYPETTQFHRFSEESAREAKVLDSLVPMTLTQKMLNSPRSAGELKDCLARGAESYWKLYEEFRQYYNAKFVEFQRWLTSKCGADPKAFDEMIGKNLADLVSSGPSKELQRLELMPGSPTLDRDARLVGIRRKVVISCTLQFSNGKTQLVGVELPGVIP
ncbi:MAG: hypothetical protein JSS71_03175 [Armatimonadetes bacterium]|nr:hypothetical protein [Armatimonadota bacterium]MBX3108385.1 hypothetical protein [Fimbriimonadaceae bacterium]